MPPGEEGRAGPPSRRTSMPARPGRRHAAPPCRAFTPAMLCPRCRAAKEGRPSTTATERSEGEKGVREVRERLRRDQRGRET
jgi:hypothetical protein